MSIPARINVITLGAHDLPELRDFYVRLGWDLAVEGDDFCAFAMRGAVLTIYPRSELAADGHTTQAPPNEGVGITIAVNVDEREQVDAAIEAVKAAGAHVLKEPEDAFWGGRSAYWADPENNVWEIAWAPADNSVAKLVRAATG
jgi:uncharacterized protein